jgi:hypothetical protein
LTLAGAKELLFAGVGLDSIAGDEDVGNPEVLLKAKPPVKIVEPRELKWG